MDRKIAMSVFVGIFTAGFATALYLWISHTLFPPEIPEGFKEWPDDAKYLFVTHLPPVQYISVIVAQGLAILTGIFAGRMLYMQTKAPLYIVLIIMLMMSGINFFSHPHPMWFLFADLGFSGILGVVFIRSLKQG